MRSTVYGINSAVLLFFYFTIASFIVMFILIINVYRLKYRANVEGFHPRFVKVKLLSVLASPD
jgi:hypothetical protein